MAVAKEIGADTEARVVTEVDKGDTEDRAVTTRVTEEGELIYSLFITLAGWQLHFNP